MTLTHRTRPFLLSTASLIVICLLVSRIDAQENIILEPYSCAEFLKDAREPADGSRLVRSLMMIAWATGYAAAHQKDSPRADPKAIQLIAATLGDACRGAPERQAVQAVAEIIARFATAGPSSGVSPPSPMQGRTPSPKDTFKECDFCPEMVIVPSGSFLIGSPENEAMRSPDEGPQYTVTIGRSFAVGKFAVKFEEWDACVSDGGCNGHRPSDEEWGRGRRPVINVSWHDAKAYVEWLSRKTGKSYRLLSEAEREYVTRAGTTTPFWWGISASTTQANYDGNLTYGNTLKGTYQKKTVPVDSFKPNTWGFYQVHGNVWEWVEDCWNISRSDAPTDGSPWITDNCIQRVRRGGSWRNHPQFLRAAVRGPTAADGRFNNIGFRVARSL